MTQSAHHLPAHSSFYGSTYFGISATYSMPNDTERPDTMASPPPSADDIATSPRASEAPIVRSERPAIAPPPRTPDDAELGATALARSEPPEWWKASFIGQALGKFADDAEEIRRGRNAQHAEQMASLRELRADQVLIQRELQVFRQAVNETKVDTDRQLADLRREVAEVKTRMERDRAEYEATREADRIAYESKFQEQQACLDSVTGTLAEIERARDAEARPAQAPTEGA